MKIRLRVNMKQGLAEIHEVIKGLEQHLGKEIQHDFMVSRGFYNGKGWAIDHCMDHWELRVDARTARKSWMTAFLLRWT